MNKKIESEIAIGILIIVAILVGGAFWMQSEKAQTPVVEPVATQQPIAPATQTQPTTQTAATQPLVTGKQGAVYTNTDYGFQFTMPQDWMNIIGDYQVNITKNPDQDAIAFVEFAAKTTDKNWGSSTAPLFMITVSTNDQWTKAQALTVCKKYEGSDECRVGEKAVIAKANGYVYAMDIEQDYPQNFDFFKNAANSQYPYLAILNPVKNGFKLISQNQ